MPFLLLRHGETDWPAVNAHGWPGAANDLAPLTPAGVDQAEEAAQEVADPDISLVLSSPMTRAMQTAAIVAARLDLPLGVELDLREWLPDESFAWTQGEQVMAAYEDMLRCGGARPADHPYQWEPLDSVRSRARATLQRYRRRSTVLVVTHEVFIHAVTGHAQTATCGSRPLPDDFWSPGPSS
jgi:broad specificity phosphatase PhoE